ncbi:helix-turn-helix domain-containing protein [Pedobacter alpinus]|uniref:Helix-turn-helix domain-containing protein n=1 Tax=Pedobacter alpinus TaxID=1590643 RepID=A0ABW5TM26_9SPHI
MLFEFNLYSTLPLIFFFHILIYSILFFIRSSRQENYADKLMGWFLFIGAFIVVPWMVGFAGWYDNQPYRDILFFTPFVHTLAIGPLLYVYVRAITDFNFRITGKAYLHFLPAILYLVYRLTSTGVDILVFDKYNLTNEYEDPDFAGWYSALSTLSVLVYLFLSIKHFRAYKQYIKLTTSFADLVSLKWLRNFLYAFGLLTILPIIKDILSNFSFFEKMRYFCPWFYYVAFAIVVYYIAINAYQAVYIHLRKIEFKPQLLLAYQETGKDLELKPDEEVVVLPVDEKGIELKNGILKLMEDELLFEQPDLTLSDIAEKLATNSVILSKAVNQQFGMNFNDFINQYRVNAVIERIKDPKFKNQTLLAIAFDAGFNSKATFNRAFKKFTNKNPKEYLN